MSTQIENQKIASESVIARPKETRKVFILVESFEKEIC
tara:strand:- start:618 stop:731 length:114 start_codon:yes stop_codon:yes gene_type:complete